MPITETITKPTLLEDLIQRRETLGAEWDTLIDDAEKRRSEFEDRSKAEDVAERPTDADRDAYNLAEDEFRSASEDLESKLKVLNERIAQQEEKAQRRAVAEKESRVHVTDVKEPLTYREDNSHEVSYYRDLICTDTGWKGRIMGDWKDAEERLRRHGREMEDRLPQREMERARAAEEGIDSAEREFRSSFPGLGGTLEASPFEKRANPSRETGHGGEFVPPLWLVEDDFIPALRAGRVIAPLCRNLPVPPGTDTIKLPKIKVGTEVAPQLADNAGVASRDVESTYVEAAVKTLAGQEDVAIQLIEQSPGQVFDRVVQEDLLADYNLKFDQNVSFGQGTSYTQLNAGTIKGLFPQANWAAGVRNSTSATAPAVILGGLAANWAHIAKERFNVQNVHHVINPAFSGFLAASLDGTSGEIGRPMINATDFPNYNLAAEMEPETPYEGFFAKTPLGPVIYHSANIPPILPQASSTEAAASILYATDKEAKTLKTSGSEVYSYGLTAKFDDVWVFESDLRTRVLPEVVSGTLQIRFQVYAYVSLLVRYSPSVQFCGGKAWKVAAAFTEAPVEPTLGGYAF
jgi:HK97 family phage major capsid protein